MVENLSKKGQIPLISSTYFFTEMDLSDYLKSEEKDIPSTEVILKFLRSSYDYLNFASECAILTMHFVKKFSNSSLIPLTPKNYKSILTVSTLIALKLTNRDYLVDRDFGVFCSSVNTYEIRFMEIEFLTKISNSYELDLADYKESFDYLSLHSKTNEGYRWKFDLEKVNKVLKRSYMMTTRREDPEVDKDNVKRVRAVDLDALDSK